MHHSQFAKMADVLVNYSLEIVPGDVLRIVTDIIALPLIYEVYAAALRAGAQLAPQLHDVQLEAVLLREGSEEQISYLPPSRLGDIPAATKNLKVLTETDHLATIDPIRRTLRNRALGPQNTLFNQRVAEGTLRWCITSYPTETSAAAAGMSLAEYTDFLFAACRLDLADPVAAWKAQEYAQQQIADFLNTCRHIRIVAPGTDLQYRCDGRTWINSAGKLNFPDGEVYTGPIEDSVTGHITTMDGIAEDSATIHGLRLTFDAGQVVQATARQGQHLLDELLNRDAGARCVGEVAFGLNYGIQRVTGNALFDEKIGGTMHLALGRSLPGTGGTNQSSLHWDLVCDLREGEVYADGELCYKNGQFLI